MMTAIADAREEHVIHRKWNRPQSTFLRIRGRAGGPIQYVDLEGAIGSGKTTAPAWKMVEYATTYPAIFMAIGAWTDEMLGPPKTAFLEAARAQGFSPEEGTLTWHGAQGEEYYEFEGYHSRVYVRSLKASEDDMRYMKLAGLSLSIFWIDQSEPVPQDVYNAYIPARLRQPGYPHEVWLSPNPLDESHWQSKEFPTDPRKRPENYHYIRTTLYDNIAAVGAQFIADMEQKHPPGSALRHRFIDGTRGPMTRGKPIYGATFRKPIHAPDAGVLPVEEAPILQGHDFGTKHPAIVWAQLTWWGQLRILGSIEGDDLFIETFVPIFKEWRTEWFGEITPLVTCDPSGGKATRDGTQQNGVKVLQQHGMFPQYGENFNQPTQISYAIESIGGYLNRTVTQPIWFDDRCPYCVNHRPHGRTGERLPRSMVVSGGAVLHGRQVPAFQIDPHRHLVVSNADVEERSPLLNGFMGGYVYAANMPVGGINIKRPLKDDIHDHTMRCVEYIIQQFGTVRMAEEMLEQGIETGVRQMQARERQARAEIAKRDVDPADARYGKGHQTRVRPRGGW
jgi:hypothetical protein